MRNFHRHAHELDLLVALANHLLLHPQARGRTYNGYPVLMPQL